MADHAVEMSLFLYHNSDAIRTFTYYNHNAEPPHGGIKAGDAPVESVHSLQWMQDTGVIVDKWLKSVRNNVKETKPIPSDPLPDLPYKLKIDPYDDRVEYKLEMETLEVSIIYNKEKKEFTFPPRDAFDVSWQAFLYYHESVKDFVQKVG